MHTMHNLRKEATLLGERGCVETVKSVCVSYKRKAFVESVKRDVAEGAGIEPTLREPKSRVLPLDDPSKLGSLVYFAGARYRRLARRHVYRSGPHHLFEKHLVDLNNAL